MSWRIIEITPEETKPEDLTDSELIGVSILLTHHGDDGLGPRDNDSVYWRARQKIQPQVEKALTR